MFNEILLMSHVTFGIIALLGAVWLFVDVLNINEQNQKRIKIVAVIQASALWLSNVLGGYWYVIFYGADKALIKAGPWSFAHSLVMETKEHIFLILLLLSTYLMIVVLKENLLINEKARKLTLWIAGMVAFLTLGMEGAGAIISMGVKVALQTKILG